MAHFDNDELAELQKLHTLYREKCAEEIRQLEELAKAKLDVQQLRLRLQACGVTNVSLVPKELRCGGHTEDTSTAEIRNFIHWVAESCEFKDPVIFDVGSAVRVGTRDAFLGRMVSWPLTEPGGLKLNVPQTMECEIKELLQRARRRALDQKELQHFAKSWEMIGAEVAGEGTTRPAIFLIHRETDETVIVAAWPCIQPTVKATFDPDEYFKALSCKPTESVLHCESASNNASACLAQAEPERLTKSRSAGHLQQ